ncbi:MAG: hypothetical protein HC906_12040 [Bacteroidales bacterium]|nr:hypothetical protein [Bacteroidales bacterium]
MKIVEKAKKNIGLYILTKKMAIQRKSAIVCNIDEAKKVGILYNATHPISFEIIKTFTKVLAQKKSRCLYLDLFRIKSSLTIIYIEKDSIFFKK